MPGSAAAFGRDATVAWNYVDLRFSADRDLRLTARLDRDSLTVRLLGRTAGEPARVSAGAERRMDAPAARSCGSCDEVDCFRREARPARPEDRRVFLVDEAWPESFAPM